MATTVVRQTTTVTSSSSSSPVVVSFNTSFITSIGGLFTILELVLGIIVFSLMYNYGGAVHPSGIFLMLISFAYWLICFYFLLSAMLSITGSLLPSTFFFFSSFMRLGSSSTSAVASQCLRCTPNTHLVLLAS
uniref:Uncharacterized protein n=1 Tax=Ixodes ricinus TaxID=34613 RepID=A0A6B0URR0_IXORI